MNIIEFTDEELEIILKFQKQEGFATVEEAVMVAVNSYLKE